MKKFIISIIILLLVGVGVYLYYNNDNDIKNVTNKIKDTKKEIEFKDVSNSIFKDNYDKAYNKMKKMSIEEKVGQLFLVRYDNSMTIVNIFLLDMYYFLEILMVKLKRV